MVKKFLKKIILVSIIFLLSYCYSTNKIYENINRIDLEDTK